MSRILLPPGYAKRQRGFIINPYAYATGGSPSNTTALLHFNGSDGSATFTDEYLNTWARPTGGVAALETSSPFTPKFGSASLYSAYAGSGNKGGILMQNANICSFGNGDFTIDFWVYPTSYYGPDGSTLPYLFWANTELSTGATAYAPISARRNNFNDLQVLISTNGTSFVGGGPVITGTGALPNTAWRHIEICRSGSNLRLFSNGTQAGSTYNISTAALCSSEGFYLGGLYDGTEYPNYSLVGGFDELYIRKGTAAHTANFTPPSSAYSPP